MHLCNISFGPKRKRAESHTKKLFLSTNELRTPSYHSGPENRQPTFKMVFIEDTTTTWSNDWQLPT